MIDGPWDWGYDEADEGMAEVFRQTWDISIGGLLPDEATALCDALNRLEEHLPPAEGEEAGAFAYKNMVELLTAAEKRIAELEG